MLRMELLLTNSEPFTVFSLWHSMIFLNINRISRFVHNFGDMYYKISKESMVIKKQDIFDNLYF